MNFEKYDAFVSLDRLSYEFISIGPKGKIKKLVQYTLIEDYEEVTYNCAFGDLNEKEGTINDSTVTDNGDMVKVIATVVETI